MNKPVSPAPEAEQASLDRGTLGLAQPYAEPRPGPETEIAEAFARVLRVTPVGRDDEFFELGGDSLAAEQIAMEVERIGGRPVPLSALFDHGTPALLAEWLGATAAEGLSDDSPYFLIHARHGYIFPDQRFLSALSEGRRLVTIDLPGLRDPQPTPTTIAGMARVHADRIMKDYPDGPVCLASFCTGWMIAAEVANLLVAAGRSPVRLVLFDPDCPSVHYLRYRREAEGLGLPSSRTYWARRLLGLRLFDSSWQGEYSDPVHYWRLVLYYWLKGPVRDGDIKSWMARFRSHGMSRWALAKLLAAYRTHWPTPCQVKVHLVTSRYHFYERRKGSGFWEWALPDYTETQVADNHSDVNGARGFEAATEMVRAFEGSG